MLRRGLSSSLGFARAFALGALALAVVPSAQAGSYDPICSKYVESRGFQKFYNTRKGERKAGDTIYWETKVLPDFERIAKDPKFQSEANLNAQFKVTLASYGIRENEIAEANENRLISDCSRQPQLEGCLAMQTYCVRDYIQKEWPKAVENFNTCFDKSSREHGCGTDFQTADGIAKNLAVLQKFQGKVGAINDEMLKLPNVPDYLNDITTSFQNFSAKVQNLLAKGKARIDDLKKQEAAAADKRYQSTVAMQNNLGQACRAFNECKGYLDRKGYADSKQLLNQISSCQVRNESTPESGKQFDETMKTMKDIHSAAQKSAMADLIKDTFNESLGQTARQYLEGYFAINGRLPTEAAFKAAVGGRFPGDILKKYYDDAKANQSSMKKMDVGAEISAFNVRVKALNAACAAVKVSGASAKEKEKDAATQGQLAAVGDAYNGLLYGSRFGSLFALKSFSNKVGSFNSEDCFTKGEGMHELTASDSGRVVDALNDALSVIGDKGRELVRNQKDLTDPEDPGSGLRFFLENDPLVLRELIRKTNSAEQAMLLCGSIETIYSKEARHKFWSKVLTGLAIAGAVVATVMSAGAAAPGLVAIVSASAIGVGTVNGLINIDYAMNTKTHMQQSGISGTFDRDVSNNLIAQSRAEIKGEAIGIGLQFVPVVGKSAAGVVSKTVIPKVMATEIMQVVSKTKAWQVGATVVNGSTKAVGTFMNSLNKGTATFGELSGALLSRVTTQGAGRVWAATFNAISQGMSQDMAMIFTATALTHPDPFSEDGLLQMLEAFVQSRGVAALGASGGEIYRRLKAGGGMKSLFTNKLVSVPEADMKLVTNTRGGTQSKVVGEKTGTTDPDELFLYQRQPSTEKKTVIPAGTSVDQKPVTVDEVIANTKTSFATEEDAWNWAKEYTKKTGKSVDDAFRDLGWSSFNLHENFTQKMQIVKDGTRAPTTDLAFHGTSTAFFESIQQHGLDLSKGKTVNGGMMITGEGVPFARDIDYTRSFANQTSKKAGGDGVIFRWKTKEKGDISDIELGKPVPADQLDYSFDGQHWYDLKKTPLADAKAAEIKAGRMKAPETTSSVGKVGVTEEKTPTNKSIEGSDEAGIVSNTSTSGNKRITTTTNESGERVIQVKPTKAQIRTAAAKGRNWNPEEFSERSWMAKEVLGPDHGPITAKEEVAIFEAHLVGDGVHGYGTYTKTELLQKRRILAAAGFADHEIEALLRSGVCGGPPPIVTPIADLKQMYAKESFPTNESFSVLKAKSTDEVKTMMSDLHEKMIRLKECGMDCYRSLKNAMKDYDNLRAYVYSKLPAGEKSVFIKSAPESKNLDLAPKVQAADETKITATEERGPEIPKELNVSNRVTGLQISNKPSTFADIPKNGTEAIGRASRIQDGANPVNMAGAQNEIATNLAANREAQLKLEKSIQQHEELMKYEKSLPEDYKKDLPGLAKMDQERKALLAQLKQQEAELVTGQKHIADYQKQWAANVGKDPAIYLNSLPKDKQSYVVLGLEQSASGVNGLTNDQVERLLWTQEKALKNGTYKFEGLGTLPKEKPTDTRTAMERADDALFTLAAKDGIDMRNFPLLKQRLESRTGVKFVAPKNSSYRSPEEDRTWLRTEGDKTLKRVSKRKMSDEDLEVLEEAHQVGHFELGKDGKTQALTTTKNYTEAQLREKTRILRKRFSDKEASELIRDEVAGFSGLSQSSGGSKPGTFSGESDGLLSSEKFDALKGTYPDNRLKVQKWKDQTRKTLKDDFVAKGMSDKDANIAARSAVNKIETEAKTPIKVTEAKDPVSSGFVYTDPGQHNPQSKSFRGGGLNRTSVLPGDASEVFKTARSKDGRTWWGVSCLKAGPVYYRYQANGKDSKFLHWNGKTGSTGLDFAENLVPNAIRKVLAASCP
ncbi:MAG: hypothetical protein JST04_17415 [Bdellovibrionales bacterium]|nr:hypothetical protein [Bdellovibrionales bacterium]